MCDGRRFSDVVDVLDDWFCGQNAVLRMCRDGPFISYCWYGLYIDRHSQDYGFGCKLCGFVARSVIDCANLIIHWDFGNDHNSIDGAFNYRGYLRSRNCNPTQDEARWKRPRRVNSKLIRYRTHVSYASNCLPRWRIMLSQRNANLGVAMRHVKTLR